MKLFENIRIFNKKKDFNRDAIKSPDDKKYYDDKKYELLNIALDYNDWVLQGGALNLVNKDFDLGDIDILQNIPDPEFFFARVGEFPFRFKNSTGFPFNFYYCNDYPKFCDELYSKFKKHEKYKEEYVREFAKTVLKELLEENNGENLDKINNNKVLIDIALTTYNKNLKYKIINRYNIEVFSYIARQRLGYNISKSYLNNYLNQNTLKYIALNDPNQYVKLKAVEKITDNDLLCEIFEKTNILKIKIKCIQNMTDKMMLNGLKQDFQVYHYSINTSIIENRLEKLNNNQIKVNPPIRQPICLDELDTLIKNGINTSESILEYIINNSSKQLQIQASNKLKNEYKLVNHGRKIIAIKKLE